jgi:hypothetical protein
MSQYDVPSLYQFLVQTPEQGLRKILVDNKSFTDGHFNMMMKIVRACDEAKFTEHFEKTDFPKIKFGPAEVKIKEKFWPDAVAVWKSRGLLNPAQKTAA